MRLTLDSLQVGLAALWLVHGCDLTNQDNTKCGELVACGGDVTGTWVVDEVCWETDITSLANSELDYPTECGSVVQSVTRSLSGKVKFDSGTETGELTTEIESEYFYSADCIAALGSEASATVCHSLADGVAGGDVRSAECRYSGGGCACSTTYESAATINRTYEVSDGMLTFGGDESTAKFCIEGDTMRIEAEEAGLSGTINLTRTD